MRCLFHIPIIHSAADFGSLSESAKAQYVEQFDPNAWAHHERAIEQLWAAIRQRVDVLNLDYTKVRLYQDGLPVCGFEEKIVREVAEAGSSNHQFLLELIDKGAMLEGTEDPQLLIQEYQMQKEQLEAESQPPATGADRKVQADELLAARDRFIARRIDETLKAGETGLLFLGALHPLEAIWSTGIEVKELANR